MEAAALQTLRWRHCYTVRALFYPVNTPGTGAAPVQWTGGDRRSIDSRRP